MNWDDLRIVLAIGEAGSLSGAGRALGLSHATVFRRLAALEERLAVRLFERSRGGYVPTAAGEELLAAAGRVGDTVAAAERRVYGRDLRPSGSLRVTTTDTLLHGLLLPLCPEFRKTYPEIELELVASNQRFDLTRREADIALRPAAQPPDRLVGRKVGAIACGVYGPLQAVAGLLSSERWQESDWIAPDADFYFPALDTWMERSGVGRRVVLRLDSLLGVREAVATGLGLAVLPCYLGDADPRLRKLEGPLAGLETDLWLLTHPDLRRVARIRAFMDFAAASIGGLRMRLAGRTAAPA